MRTEQASEAIRRTLNDSHRLADRLAETEDDLYDLLYEALWPATRESALQDPYLEEMAIEHTFGERNGAAAVAFALTETRRGEKSSISVAFRRLHPNGAWEAATMPERSGQPPAHRQPASREERQLAGAIS